MSNVFDGVFRHMNWEQKVLGEPPSKLVPKCCWSDKYSPEAIKALSRMKGETKTLQRTLYFFEREGVKHLAVTEGRKEK